MTTQATASQSPAAVHRAIDLSLLLDEAAIKRAISVCHSGGPGGIHADAPSDATRKAAAVLANRLELLLDRYGVELLAQLAVDAGPDPERVLRGLVGAAENGVDIARAAELEAREARARRREETAAVRSTAVVQFRACEAELTSIEQRLARAPAERAAARKRLEAAGLSSEQVAGLELPPTQDELSQMHQRAHQLRAQVAVLLKFMNDPRREVLGGLELHGWPVGTLPGERAAAALESAA